MLIGLALLVGCHGGNNQPASPVPEARILPATFLRGMTFAHEGYRGHNGYGGDLVGPSMDSLKVMGVNAVAIVPYTFMRGEGVVDTFPIPDHYGAENDSAVLHSIRNAEARGLYVMLKPQIWVRGSWPGDIDFATEAEWDTLLPGLRGMDPPLRRHGPTGTGLRTVHRNGVGACDPKVSG